MEIITYNVAPFVLASPQGPVGPLDIIDKIKIIKLTEKKLKNI